MRPQPVHAQTLFPQRFRANFCTLSLALGRPLLSELMAPRQPQPEVVHAYPPPGARPFGVVTQDPSPATPAGKAGLAVGDALLSFGTARHLRDVQAELAANIGTPVVVMLVDQAGRHMRKFVVPHAWDPSAPKSLLGCQMSNQFGAAGPNPMLRPSCAHRPRFVLNVRICFVPADAPPTTLPLLRRRTAATRHQQ